MMERGDIYLVSLEIQTVAQMFIRTMPYAIGVGWNRRASDGHSRYTTEFSRAVFHAEQPNGGIRRAVMLRNNRLSTAHAYFTLV
uniref:Uncharacterized protein n=1 Tax=Candidatus Kentrum sp. DK TaxID=2126562 RepID=A0A450THV1_9GAMM|nr:MAG: hypothetical protein BECKDK2373C_GA0170839_115511 [Candidatus Kentron sp. DK]